MSSQPPYGDYPPQNQPWQGQPPDPSYPGYAQPGAYPPPPSYGDAPYPPPPGQPGTPMYGAPNIYMQPAPYPYVVAAPPDPGAGQAVTSLVLGIISIVFTFIPCFGFVAIVTGIIGLIMGILGRKSVTRHGMAVTGIVLSAISLGLSVLFTILYIGLNILTLTLPTQ
ncbi:MAG TPA: DUF4190 domain-containing protein [Ktedonobacterales bacterium]|nr:DUF4190 domain-containing protein [Ktedonobacterales bacterium]